VITLILSGNDFKYELEAVCRIFVGSAKIDVVYGGETPDDGDWVLAAEDGGRLTARVSIGGTLSEKSGSADIESPDFGQECERVLALLIYQAFSELTGRRPDWGVLTGIRPVKLVYKYWEKGMSDEEIVRLLGERYYVSEKKSRVLVRTAHTEKKAVELSRPESFSLYIAVPFCPTRCKYCSFVSHSIDKAGKLIPEYVELLCEELKSTGDMVRELGLCLETVYMGGGTPTVLTAGQLTQVLSVVNGSFDVSAAREFTVEAGRPDTVTEDKLDALISCGVDRISINPQTMSDSVLENIGRRHTAEQTLKAYEMARRRPFKVINMDLIAGLPGDDTESFGRTLETVTSLEPENITVHTLSIKRAAGMNEGGEQLFAGSDGRAVQMLDRAYSLLEELGYLPYYLYRQKNTLDNLENVGFARDGYDGLYNIYIMAETHTIIAAGAGGVTKLCAPDGLIERTFNYKYPYEYNSRFDTILKRKEEVKRFYERYSDKKDRS